MGVGGCADEWVGVCMWVSGWVCGFGWVCRNICRSRSNLVGVNFDAIESADIAGQRFSECGFLKHTWRK